MQRRMPPRIEDASLPASQNSPVLFRSIDVWERRTDCAIRFRCFEILGRAKFWVQSRDFYRLDDRESNRTWLDKNFIEVFCETSLEDVELFESLQEAIACHRAEFVIHLES